jgi:hypothetical protein
MYRSLDVQGWRGWRDNRDSGVGQEIVKFIDVDVIVGVRFKNVGGGVSARAEIAIVFGVVDRVVGAAFNDEAAGLNEWLTILEGEGFDAGDGGVGHGEFDPLVAGDAGTTRERQEIVVTGRVAGRVKSNGPDGTRLGRVGGVVVFEHLNIGAEFKFEFVKIRGGNPGDEGRGAESVGNAVDTGKTVKVANDVVNHMLNKKAWESAKRKAVDTGTETLLHSADGTLDFADVTVGGNKINHDREKSVANAGEFVVGVDVANAETTGSVRFDSGPEAVEDGGSLAIRNGENSAISDVARNGMEKRNLLDVKEIGAQSDVEVMVSNRRRNRHGLELGYMRGGGALGSSALEKRNVGSVNNEGASCVLRSNGAVAEVITFEDTLEIGFRGSP